MKNVLDKYEKLDLYDENRNKLDKVRVRYKDRQKKGEYVIATQATIINSKGEILISQRSPKKKFFPLKWECNGGAVLAGETSKEGIIRELSEELGLKFNINDAIYLKTDKNERRFKDIFLFFKDIDIKDIAFSDGESIAAKWVDIDEFEDMYNQGDICESVNFNRSDYTKCIDLLKKRGLDIKCLKKK